MVAGIVRSNKNPFQVETSAGLFELNCEVVPVSARDEVVPVSARDKVVPVPAYHPESLMGRDVHVHSVGDQINLLVSRRGVQQSAGGKVSGVVVDVVFRQDGFKVTLDNGLDFYLPKAPLLGEKIYLSIPAAGEKFFN